MPTTDPLLLDLPSSIQTPRLLMRTPREGDGAALHEAVLESLDDLRRFPGAVPWAHEEQTPSSAELHCRSAHADFIARRQLAFLLFDRLDGTLVGSAGLFRPDWSVPRMEIGYWVRSSRVGEGLITEAAGALTTYAFNRLEAARIEMTIDERNVASRRVAERCGYVLEGVLRHNRRDQGSLRSTCMYARCWLRHSGGYDSASMHPQRHAEPAEA